MKVFFEIRDGQRLLVTETGDIVENVEVLGINMPVEATKEGPMRRLEARVRIHGQHEIKAYGRNN